MEFGRMPRCLWGKRLDIVRYDTNSNHIFLSCAYSLTGEFESVVHLQNNAMGEPAQLQNIFLSTSTILIRG